MVVKYKKKYVYYNITSNWQSNNFTKYYFQKMYVLNFSKKIFDIFLQSYMFEKFLKNFSYNFNEQKVYKYFLKVFNFLFSKFKVKGYFLFIFIVFNVLFSSFFENTTVRVAGRNLKVPNPIMANKSYRVVTKNFSKILRKKNEKSFQGRFYQDLINFDSGNSFITNYNKNLLNELVESRVNERFRWKYREGINRVNRLNP